MVSVRGNSDKEQSYQPDYHCLHRHPACDPWFSPGETMNLWRIRSRNVNQRTYEVAHKTLGCRIQVPFSNLTAFPEKNTNMAETISTTDLVVENSTFRKQLWESENALAVLQSQLRALQILAKTTDDEKEAMRIKLVACSKNQFLSGNLRWKLSNRVLTILFINQPFNSFVQSGHCFTYYIKDKLYTIEHNFSLL